MPISGVEICGAGRETLHMTQHNTTYTATYTHTAHKHTHTQKTKKTHAATRARHVDQNVGGSASGRDCIVTEKRE